jgi:hypothetical protein
MPRESRHWFQNSPEKQGASKAKDGPSHWHATRCRAKAPKNDSAHPWFFTDPVAQNQKFFLRRKSLGWGVVSA